MRRASQVELRSSVAARQHSIEVSQSCSFPPETVIRRALHTLDARVLALQSRLHQASMSEDEDRATADEPKERGDGRSDP